MSKPGGGLPPLKGYEVSTFGEAHIIRKSSTLDLITEECDAIKKLLLEKNAKYGNSALEPIRVFSKADPQEQLRVRIDDKLSRILTSDPEDTEDAVTDLIGYLILYKVAQRGNA